MGGQSPNSPLFGSRLSLTLSLFPWAKFRKTKGAIKLHAMLHLPGGGPLRCRFTHQPIWGGAMKARTVPEIVQKFLLQPYQDLEIDKRLFFDVWAD